MAPSQKMVEVSELSIELVVFLRIDLNDMMGKISPDFFSYFDDCIIAERFGIPYSQALQSRNSFAFSIDTGNAQRTKKIPFARLIDTNSGSFIDVEFLISK